MINENLLIDTNVLIYSLDRTSKYFSFCNRILEDYSNIYITTKNVSEFVCVLSKKAYYDIISYDYIEEVEIIDKIAYLNDANQ
jgi:predicted nucleic acid-binding protein